MSVTIKNTIARIRKLALAKSCRVQRAHVSVIREGQNRLRISQGFRSSEARKARGRKPSRLYLARGNANQFAAGEENAHIIQWKRAARERLSSRQREGGEGAN